jgi:hypothetical protein
LLAVGYCPGHEVPKDLNYRQLLLLSANRDKSYAEALK